MRLECFSPCREAGITYEEILMINPASVAALAVTTKDSLRGLELHHQSMRAALEAHKAARVFVLELPEVDLGFWNKVILVGLAQASAANMIGILKRVFVSLEEWLPPVSADYERDLVFQAHTAIAGLRPAVISEKVRLGLLDVLEMKDLVGDDLPNDYPEGRAERWCEYILEVEADFRKDVEGFLERLGTALH